jgi:hypothetical protein
MSKFVLVFKFVIGTLPPRTFAFPHLIAPPGINVFTPIVYLRVKVVYFDD